MTDQKNLYVHVYDHKWGHWFRMSGSLVLYSVLIICNHRFGGGSMFVDGVLFALLFLAGLARIALVGAQFAGSAEGAILWLQSKNVRDKYSDQTSKIQEESDPR